MHYDLLFGPNSIVYPVDMGVQGFQKPAFLLFIIKWPALPLVFLLLVVFFSLGLLFYKNVPFYFLIPANFIIWLAVINLHNRIYPTLTGGNYLLNQFLFFNIFLSTFSGHSSNAFPVIRIGMHNFAIFGVMLQVCLVYSSSAITKLSDPLWRSGLALDQTLQIHHYFIFGSAPFLFFRPLIIFLNYAVICYQVLFPLFVFLPVLKKPFLIAGILMHLYIALIMGLLDFGVIMIVGYIYFWPFKYRVP